MLDIFVIFIAAATFILGLSVVQRSWHRPINLYYFLLSSCISFWILSNVFTDLFNSLLWFKLTYSIGALLPAFAWIWAIYFSEKSIKFKQQIVLFSLALIFFAIPLINTLVVVNAKNFYLGRIDGELGPLFPLYALYQMGTITGLVVWLFKKRKKQISLRRTQYSYIIIAFAGFGVVPIIFSFILPLFGILTFAGLDSPSVSIFLGTLAYAFVRHRLLDIKFIITRSLIYGLLLTIVTLSFVFITFLSAQLFGNTLTSRNIIAFIVAILIVYGLDPLKNWLSIISDKAFFKAKINYQTVLRQLTETLNFELDQNTLIRKLRTTLQQELKVKSAATLLRKGNHTGTVKFEALPELLSTNPNLSVQNDSGLVRYLREHKHTSLLESLERKIEDTPENRQILLVASKNEFERMGAALATPIYAQGHLIAILALGPKLSGDSFSNDDIQLIEVLGPQIGSAIQKANLFEEVRRFSESLKVKVEEATVQLRERNVSLETLQQITKEITRTLDFNKVVQQIADSVSKDLGYLGAIVVLLDDDGHTVRPRAVTATMLTTKALKFLPKPLSEYPSDLNDPNYANLEAEVMHTGQIQTTNHIRDIICPPMPRLFADTMQKILGIKSIVVVPVISEGKTIGAIEIGTKKSQGDISAQEIAIMQSMADELGVVYRNLKLFDRLRQTNAQLEVANKHLQELDRAKSEFVSIASHQLRTPMTGIKGYLSMMTQGDFGKMKPEHTELLKKLLGESDRMIRLINQFLNVSKIEAGKFTYQKVEVHLEDLIKREIEEVTNMARDKGLKLVLKFPAEPLPTLIADADKLQDVILNLVDNAIKYTAKGSVTIGAEPVNGHPSTGSGQVIHFWVKDTGIGIKPSDATELFSKFVRGTGIAQIHPDGSGLGLFIAKSIIDAHGGRIWAESAGEGKGSTFQFVLPLNPPVSTAPSGHDAAAHVVSTKRL